MTILDEIKNSVDYLQNRLGNDSYNVGTVLGTGFGEVVDELSVSVTIPYIAIPSFPHSLFS